VMKLSARSMLVGIYLPRGEHAQAAAHCRTFLASLSGLPRKSRASLEADMRRRLADCLEALGQVDEAREERRRAGECMKRTPGDTLGHQTRGTLLEREHRYAEAYEEHRKALALTPPGNKEVRMECMMHLVLSAYNAGRPADCLHWAEKMLALGATGRFLRSAHRMAGIACGNLSLLEESERHTRQAYEAAVAEGSNSDIADNLALLGNCLFKRGKLAEAHETCAQAAALDPKGKRMAGAVQMQILREWGRYDEALAFVVPPETAAKFNIPHFERRAGAVRALEAARIQTDAGRPEDAWQQLQEALKEFRDDAKLSLKCDSTAAWILASRGLVDESRQVVKMLEPRLAGFADDPSTQRGVYYELGLAANARCDHQAGIDCWTRYLALSPDPVYHPTAYYYRGECHRQLGQLAEAKRDYEAAVAMNFDTHSTELAKRRLSVRENGNREAFSGGNAAGR
jgi:tetratricopeptide (TPR) repeat protein